MPTKAARVGLLAALSLLVVVAAAVLWWQGGGDDGEESATTTVPSSASTTTTTTTEPPAVDPTVLWPFPGSATTYTTPTDAARTFATEFLRFAAPVVDPFQQGDSRSGEVPVRPIARGPVTTILVRQVGPGDGWSVLGAVTENIQVTEPAPATEISSPVTVRGRALAFEGTVQVEIRQDGALGEIGEGFVTGGGDVLRDFTGSIGFETPGAPKGAIVFFTESAENGQVWEATTVRVALRSTDIDAAACGTYRSPRLTPGEGQMEVKAYFNCDGQTSQTGGVALHPVYRLVPRTTEVLRASLDALLGGPTQTEREASLSSFFSAETKEMLRSVTITDGHAVVDFDDVRAVIPNASSSAGSARLLAELDTTVFQFRSVESVEYRIEGSCTDFNEWLQYGGCDKRTRSEVSSD